MYLSIKEYIQVQIRFSEKKINSDILSANYLLVTVLDTKDIDMSKADKCYHEVCIPVGGRADIKHVKCSEEKYIWVRGKGILSYIDWRGRP